MNFIKTYLSLTIFLAFIAACSDDKNSGTAAIKPSGSETESKKLEIQGNDFKTIRLQPGEKEARFKLYVKNGFLETITGFQGDNSVTNKLIFDLPNSSCTAALKLPPNAQCYFTLVTMDNADRSYNETIKIKFKHDKSGIEDSIDVNLMGRVELLRPASLDPNNIKKIELFSLLKNRPLDLSMTENLSKFRGAL